jgi:hypothetical protein
MKRLLVAFLLLTPPALAQPAPCDKENYSRAALIALIAADLNPRLTGCASLNHCDDAAITSAKARALKIHAFANDLPPGCAGDAYADWAAYADMQIATAEDEAKNHTIQKADDAHVQRENARHAVPPQVEQALPTPNN